MRVSDTLVLFRDTLLTRPGLGARGIGGATSQAATQPDETGRNVATSDGHKHGTVRTATGNSARISVRGGLYKDLKPKPADVTKALPPDARYEGKPTENIQRKYQLFLTACRLSGIDANEDDQILDLMYPAWLKGAARAYFADRLQSVECATEAVKCLEDHFLHVRVRGVNEERWNSLSYELARRRQAADRTTDRTHSHESALNVLFNEIDEL